MRNLTSHFRPFDAPTAGHARAVDLRPATAGVVRSTIVLHGEAP